MRQESYKQEDLIRSHKDVIMRGYQYDTNAQSLIDMGKWCYEHPSDELLTNVFHWFQRQYGVPDDMLKELLLTYER